MIPRLQLSTRQVEDLAKIRDLEPGKVKSVADLVDTIDLALNPKKLLEAVNNLLGDEETAETIVRQTVSLCGLTKQTGMLTDQIAAGLSEAIKRDAAWTFEQLQRWSDIEPHLLRILKSRSVRMVANVIDLSYEYANLYRRARILTDVRPLFTDAADEIEGAVVTYTLRLRYDSVDGEHGLSVALDEEDVRDLRSQCDRALRKAETAQELLVRKAEVPTVVAGGKDDA